MLMFVSDSLLNNIIRGQECLEQLVFLKLKIKVEKFHIGVICMNYNLSIGSRGQKNAEGLILTCSLHELMYILLIKQTKKEAKPPIDPVKSFRITTPVVDQCADVKQILRDVEIQRSNLEHNLDAIVRQNEAESLYATVDNLMQGAQGYENIVCLLFYDFVFIIQ